jgi:hypothetical protein
MTVAAPTTIWLLSPAAAMAAGPVVTSGVTNSPAYVARSHGAVTSNNWSGYAVQTSKEFTEVVGSWVQPAVDCTQTTGRPRSAFWVGLDGYANQTVEQIGTQSSCADGSASYFAWWQMYPSPFVTLSTSAYPVDPGDTLTATVTRSGTSYTLSLGSSAGWTYSTVQTGDGANSSAEWIASSPPLCPSCGYSRLSDFGEVTFSGARAAAGGKLRPISSYRYDAGPEEITMLGTGGITRAQPSSLTSNGKGFSVTWDHS